MREIKFRAWNKDDKCWHRSTQFVIRPYSGKVSDGATVPNVELMQYTGLKDINKKPIYEGDIVKIYTAGDEYYCDKFTVEHGLYGWNLSDMEDGFMTFEYVLSENGDSLEVIGNIYENSDLLKEKANADHKRN